jgi:hypothetical protein
VAPLPVKTEGRFVNDFAWHDLFARNMFVQVI